MNEELLRGCFKRLRKEAVAGIDEMTNAMYAENLVLNCKSRRYDVDSFHLFVKGIANAEKSSSAAVQRKGSPSTQGVGK
jgi:hypothetical protein